MAFVAGKKLASQAVQIQRRNKDREAVAKIQHVIFLGEAHVAQRDKKE